MMSRKRAKEERCAVKVGRVREGDMKEPGRREQEGRGGKVCRGRGKKGRKVQQNSRSSLTFFRVTHRTQCSPYCGLLS